MPIQPNEKIKASDFIDESSGASDSGKGVKLNGSGKFDSSFIVFPEKYGFTKKTSTGGSTTSLTTTPQSVFSASVDIEVGNVVEVELVGRIENSSGGNRTPIFSTTIDTVTNSTDGISTANTTFNTVQYKTRFLVVSTSSVVSSSFLEQPTTAGTRVTLSNMSSVSTSTNNIVGTNKDININLSLVSGSSVNFYPLYFVLQVINPIDLT